MQIWAIRLSALAVLALVLWLAGPRAWVVLSAELRPEPGQRVDLDRVGLREAPAWLRADTALQVAVLESLSPYLRGGLAIRDAERGAALCAALQQQAWVRRASLRRSPVGDRPGFELDLELRRPELWLEPIGYAKGEVRPCLVDAAGVCLPLPEQAGKPKLPRHEIDSGVQAGSLPVYTYGQAHPRPEVLAAARVAREWRELIRPRVPGLPSPSLIDARPLDQRGDRDTILRGQVLLALPNSAGGECLVRYGYAPEVPFQRVGPDQRVRLLQRILSRWPGLVGLQRVDLRFPERWEDQVVELGAPGSLPSGK